MFWQRPLFSFLVALGALALSATTTAGVASGATGGDFTLHGPQGAISLSDLRGKVVLIFFGYTSCSDVCPLSLARIDACLSVMSENEVERVRALFITLDPERDTTETLARYTGYFHPNIIGLRDDIERIDAVTEQYGVVYARKAMPGSALGYSISHPADIFLLDTRGRLVELVPHDAEPEYLLARIRELLNASN